MARSRVRLAPTVSRDCEFVLVPHKYAGGKFLPAGTVCEGAVGGWYYHSYPSRRESGPVPTKARAIVKVVQDYRKWLEHHVWK